MLKVLDCADAVVIELQCGEAYQTGEVLYATDVAEAQRQNAYLGEGHRPFLALSRAFLQLHSTEDRT